MSAKRIWMLACLLLIAALFVPAQAAGGVPNAIDSGVWHGGHCQGIAVDRENGFIYYSFTTELVKTDLQGNLIGSVTGLLGHLGCIDFCDRDGRLYGSLEYKRDAIGQDILERLGSDAELEDAFYIAIFDADRINRENMDATRDGVMTAVYLKEVVDDYSATVQNGGKSVSHRYGCSGVDGTAFGKIPGGKDDRDYLFVSYGVYSDLERTDNDYQVILCYDTSDWAQYAQPLDQEEMHHSGPETPARKFFVYTGNTTYGVQNLEYDAATGNFLMAVYRGKKESFPNYALYAIDGSKAPVRETLVGVEPETEGEVLSLLDNGTGERTPGWDFDLGSRGMCAFDDGRFYLVQSLESGGGFRANVKLYRWDGVSPFVEAE